MAVLVSDLEGLAWSREVMGDAGPHVREVAPRILVETHARFAATQVALGLESSEPYGLMWLGVPKALVEELEDVAGVEIQRRKRARYRLPVVGGVPMIPWRYAKDRSTEVERVPFGQPVSDTRASWFEPSCDQQLPFGEKGLGDAVLAGLTDEQRDELDAYGEHIKDLASGQQVAVLAYASNPAAVLRCFFGYARLGPNDCLDWAFREELALSAPQHPRLRSVGSNDGRPAFDTGVPQAPELRPRSPLEGTPTGEPPPTNPEGTEEDG